MSNTKQISFDYHLPNSLVLQVNARVDMDGQDVHLHEVNAIVTNWINANIYLVSPFLKYTDVGLEFPLDELMALVTQEKLRDLLKDHPVKVHYNRNNVTMYIDFNQTKTVEIQTIFYQGFDINLVLQNTTELYQNICNQAIIEAKKEQL